MKTLLSVVKTLIRINIATAIISLLIFALMREQQTKQTDNRQDLSEPSQSYHTAMKAKTTAEQEQLETSYEKIAQHEQEIKKLEGEIEAYKTQVKNMLLNKDGQPSISTQKTNFPSAASKSILSLNNQASTPLLNQILKSGQKKPSQPTVNALESLNRINTPQNLVSIPILKDLSREKKISQNENLQNQSTLPASFRSSQTLTPSFNLPSSSQSVQNFRAKVSSVETTPDTRALFSPSSPQKPLDSFITPTKADSYKDSELKNRAVFMAQQLSRRVYRDYLYHSEFQSNQETENIVHANDIVAGLMVADEKGQINYGTQTYRKVQTAIRLLRRGETIDDAARRSTLTPSVLNQLIKWGENRPGSLSELSEISQASPNVK